MIALGVFMVCFGLFTLYVAFRYRLGDKFFTTYKETHLNAMVLLEDPKHPGYSRFFPYWPISRMWGSEGNQVVLYLNGSLLVALGFMLLVMKEWFIPWWVFIIYIAIVATILLAFTIQKKRWSRLKK
jgi:hypothetical protein